MLPTHEMRLPPGSAPRGELGCACCCCTMAWPPAAQSAARAELPMGDMAAAAGDDARTCWSVSAAVRLHSTPGCMRHPSKCLHMKASLLIQRKPSRVKYWSQPRLTTLQRPTRHDHCSAQNQLAGLRSRKRTRAPSTQMPLGVQHTWPQHPLPPTAGAQGACCLQPRLSRQPLALAARPLQLPCQHSRRLAASPQAPAYCQLVSRLAWSACRPAATAGQRRPA